MEQMEFIFLLWIRDLHKYLSNEPFAQYQDSMFFARFLQWKQLERSVNVYAQQRYKTNCFMDQWLAK